MSQPRPGRPAAADVGGHGWPVKGGADLVLRLAAGLSYGRRVTPGYWPLFDLRLTAPDLTLRPMTEADLGAMAELLPADVEQDPAATRYAIADDHLRRGIVLHQEYWRSVGTWRPAAWRLGFVVSAAEEIVGFQELEGNDFPTLRTVDTSSFLVQPARGRGYGKQMRRAVLALAFGPMAARAAITSAWHDNHASLGVSRAVGYRWNGEHYQARGDQVDVMVHMRLARVDWVAGDGAQGIEISGFDACRPLFGLAEADQQMPGTLY